jgi:hypothetical protein
MNNENSDEDEESQESDAEEQIKIEPKIVNDEISFEVKTTQETILSKV